MGTTKKIQKKSATTKKKSSSVGKVKQKTAFRTYEQAMRYLFDKTDYEKQKLLLSEEKRLEREREITDKKLEYQQLSNNILGPGGRAESRQTRGI